MSQYFRRINIFVFAASVTICVSLTLILTLNNKASAAGESVYFKPATLFRQGQQFKVQLWADAKSTTINVATVDFTYPTSRLTYVGFDYTGGAFESNYVLDTATAGNIKITQGTLTPKTGNLFIGTVTFTVVNDAGTVSLNWLGSSQLVRSPDSVDVLSVKTNGVFTKINAPVYRLANWMTKERLFTTSVTEKNAISGNNGWVYEGISFYTYANSITGTTPVYRLANWMTKERLFTTSVTEKNAISGNNGWVYEGAAFYTSQTN